MNPLDFMVDESEATNSTYVAKGKKRLVHDEKLTDYEIRKRCDSRRLSERAMCRLTVQPIGAQQTHAHTSVEFLPSPGEVTLSCPHTQPRQLLPLSLSADGTHRHTRTQAVGTCTTRGSCSLSLSLS